MRGSRFREWSLPVEGMVANPTELSLDDLKRLPSRTQVTQHNCEQGWSAIAEWTGVPLARVLQEVGTLPQARYVVFHTVDGVEAARAVGLARSPEDTLAEALYLYLVAKKPPRDQFASRADTRRHFMWQLQRGVVAAGALGLAACVIVAGATWLDAASLRDQLPRDRARLSLAIEDCVKGPACLQLMQYTPKEDPLGCESHNPRVPAYLSHKPSARTVDK